jgi:ABC-type dipeptide/oligopeptide/nickel transport system permease component
MLWSVGFVMHVIALGWLAWAAFDNPARLGEETFLATALAMASIPLAIFLGVRAAWRVSRRGRSAAAILAILAPLLWPVLLSVLFFSFGVRTTIEWRWPPRQVPSTEVRYDGSRARTPVKQPMAPAAFASSSAGTAVTAMPSSS